MTAISSIQNLGPTFGAELIAVGIPTTESLRAFGGRWGLSRLVVCRHSPAFHRLLCL